MTWYSKYLLYVISKYQDARHSVDRHFQVFNWICILAFQLFCFSRITSKTFKIMGAILWNAVTTCNAVLASSPYRFIISTAGFSYLTLTCRFALCHGTWQESSGFGRLGTGWNWEAVGQWLPGSCESHSDLGPTPSMESCLFPFDQVPSIS